MLNLDEHKLSGLENLKVKSDDLAKTFALSFTFFEQCIFLPPNSLVLKNCDELFDDENKVVQGKGLTITSVIQFTPSQEAFKNLTSFLSYNMITGKQKIPPITHLMSLKF